MINIRPYYYTQYGPNHTCIVVYNDTPAPGVLHINHRHRTNKEAGIILSICKDVVAIFRIKKIK